MRSTVKQFLFLITFTLCTTTQVLAANTDVKVNGEKIDKDAMNAYQAMRSQASGQPVSQEQITEEMINLYVMSQEAVKQGLDKDPNIAGQIKVQRMQTLTNALIRNQIQQSPVTQEDVQKRFDDTIASQGNKEYKARHILVKTEDEAKALIEELNEGGDFIELAKEKSTGPSGPKGGDLGWFPPSQMVKPFADAVAGMKKGQHSKQPVQTQFGWHVILKEDEREGEAPKFEDFAGRLQQQMMQEKIQALLNSIKEKAKIER